MILEIIPDLIGRTMETDAAYVEIKIYMGTWRRWSDFHGKEQLQQ